MHCLCRYAQNAQSLSQSLSADSASSKIDLSVGCANVYVHVFAEWMNEMNGYDVFVWRWLSAIALKDEWIMAIKIVDISLREMMSAAPKKEMHMYTRMKLKSLHGDIWSELSPHSHLWVIQWWVIWYDGLFVIEQLLTSVCHRTYISLDAASRSHD